MTFDPTKPVFWNVYIITNIINGKKYVGSTKNLKQRIRQHRSKSNSCKEVKKAIIEYGWDNFLIEAIRKFKNKESALSFESKTIKKLKSVIPFGYNLSPTGSNTIGYKWSDESRKKLSNSKIGKKQKPETIAKRIAFQIGRPLSNSHKLKLSIAKLGKKKSNQTKENISKSKLGKRAWGTRIKIDGVEYPCMQDAANILNVHKATISWRALNKKPGYEIVGRFPLK